MNLEKDNEEGINKGLKSLAKSSIIVFVGLILSKIFLYLYRIIIARHYGSEIYGLFALSVMLIGWFRLISGLGIKQGLLRYISLLRGKRQEKKIPPLIKISFLVLACTSLLAGILFFLFSEYISLNIFSNPDLIFFLKIFAIVTPLAVLGEAFLSVIRAYEKIGWYSFIANILGNFVKLALLGVFVFLGMNSNSVSLSYLTGALAVLIAGYFVYRAILSKATLSKEKSNTRKDNKTFKEMFSYSWPFIFYGIVLFVFYWVDSFMIGIFKSAEYVGYYNAAAPIATLLIFPLSLFGQLFFPLVTKEFSKNNMGTVKQLSQQVGKWIAMLTLPLFILFMLFPGAFINILFGQEYIVASNALRFLSIGTFISAIFTISQELLSIKGKSKLLLIDMIIAGVLNVILNFFLVPRYGITGAGFSTMISIIVLNLLFFIQAYKQLSIIPLRKRLFRIVLVAIIATSLLWFIRSFVEITNLTLILCGLFFIFVYTLLILTTNCLDKNDLYVLKELFKKFKKKKK